MNLAPVVALLERRIGLDPTTLGPNVLPAAVADRMRVLRLSDPTAYAGRLADSSEEFLELADRLIVPETWFFRGPALFTELVRHAAALQGRPCRALCLPCCTGEEPYSLAIALIDAGLDASRWAVDGIDLSPRLIAAAQRGVYRDLSFRQIDPGLRDRYFRPIADGWELNIAVRNRVQFRVGNLADSTTLPSTAGAYDLILCRNLLIYLTADARQRAMIALEQLLAPSGLLGVGHAEPQMLAGRPFTRVGPEGCFLYRHEEEPRVSLCEPGALLKSPSGFNPWVLSPEGDGNKAPGEPLRTRGPKEPPPTPNDPLALARRLADAGQLAEALAACQAHLSQGTPSASAYSLLGVIHQARGDRDAAATAFRKALYLDPTNREALTHSMLLSAQRGDAGQAAALRDRLARVGGGEP